VNGDTLAVEFKETRSIKIPACDMHAGIFNIQRIEIYDKQLIFIKDTV